MRIIRRKNTFQYAKGIERVFKRSLALAQPQEEDSRHGGAFGAVEHEGFAFCGVEIRKPGRILKPGGGLLKGGAEGWFRAGKKKYGH